MWSHNDANYLFSNISCTCFYMEPKRLVDLDILVNVTRSSRASLLHAAHTTQLPPKHQHIDWTGVAGMQTFSIVSRYSYRTDRYYYYIIFEKSLSLICLSLTIVSKLPKERNITSVIDLFIAMNETGYLDLSENVGISSNVCMLPSRLPPSIHPAVDYVQAAIVLITLILGVLMNGFVILLIARNKALHKMAFFLALQLIVAHFIFASTVLPFMFVTAVIREWRLGVFMCQLLGSIHDLIITSRYLLTFVLTIDRLVSVFSPFFHMRHGGKLSIFNSLLAWTFSLVRCVTSLNGIFNCTHYVPTFKMCSGAPYCSDNCQIHTLFFSAVLAIFGVVLPFLLYTTLFCKARIIKYRLKRSIQRNKCADSMQKRTLSVTSKNITEERHNHRATITFLILTIVIIGCALPPYILYTAQFILGVRSPPVVTILQIIIGRTLIYGLTVADPVVIMRNRDVRELLQSKLMPINARLRFSRVSTYTARRFSLSSMTTTGTNV